MIKAGDTLLFDVELLGFHEKAKERWEMSAAELMEEAIKTKVSFRSMLRSVLCAGSHWDSEDQGGRNSVDATVGNMCDVTL